MRFLENMNEDQKNAILNTEGPVLILAGAGSGKTRVLTHKIAYLIEEKKISPYNIVALTFTNKAAEEMRDRISDLLDQNIDFMWAGTFHSICVKILRMNIEKIGYDSNFVIFDTQDQRTVMKDTIKELDLNEKMFDIYSMMSFIGSQKDSMTTPDEYIKEHESDFIEKTKGMIYKTYQKKLKDNNALDFDDLITKSIELFLEDEEVLEYYQNRFEYVFVDEYQDTNKSQYKLINLLSEKNKNITVVGDLDQSIYGWRGADIRNILEFEKDYKDAKIIKLEQNYRSTKNILDAANEVIRSNMKRKSKNLWTENDIGEKIKVYESDDEYDEAWFISSEIKKVCEAEDEKLKNFAILYRTNAQSRVIEEVFIKSNIPYKIVGGLKFYDRKEIKDIVSYLRIIQNPVDNISLKRIINIPKRGIGNVTIDKIENHSIGLNESIYSSLLSVEKIKLTKRTEGLVSDFMSMIGKFMAMSEIFGVSKLIENILESTGYITELEEKGDIESRTRIENIEEFLSVAINYENKNPDGNLEDFLADISLLSDIDKTDEEIDDAVTLMTMHSAKGLEYSYVFVTGLEEGLFPSFRTLADEDELEEERRLCYVAMTRAEKVLYMTYAKQRMLYGKTSYNRSSRFIGETPMKLLEIVNEDEITKSSGEKILNRKKEDKFFKGETINRPIGKPELKKENKNKELGLKEGSKIEHKEWGIGTVVAISGAGSETLITIAFPKEGIKKLMLSYAPIKPI